MTRAIMEEPRACFWRFNLQELNQDAMQMNDLYESQDGLNFDTESGNGTSIWKNALLFIAANENARKVKLIRDIYKGIANDDVDAIINIIADEPAIVDFRNDDTGMTLLHFACRYVNKKCVKILLRAGADPNTKDNMGLRPLHKAAAYFNKEHFREDIHESEEEARARTREIITLLCDYKALVNAQDELCQQTPLHFAAKNGNSEATDILLKRGADCKIVDKSGMTPLMLACIFGAADVVQILFDRSDRNTVDMNGNTPLHFAARSGYVGVIKIFFTQAFEEAKKMLVRVNNEEKTPLELAVENGHADVIRFILENMPPIALWKKSEHHLLHVAAGRGYLEVVKCLVEIAKVDVATDNGTDDGILPLHEAAKRNHADVITYLLDQNAALLDSKDIFERTALVVAAGSNALDAMKVLVEKGARVHTVNHEGKNVLHLAAEVDAVKIIHFVMEHLGKLDEMGLTRTKGKEWHGSNSNNKQQTLNRADMNGHTPLHIAWSQGYLSSVRALQKYGAILNPIDECKNTPLQLATIHDRVDVVRQLLEWDDRLALAKDCDGNTPLNCAALLGHAEVASLLCDSGADLMARNEFGLTPSLLACKMGHLSVLKILIQKALNEDVEEEDLPILLRVAASGGHDAIIKFLVEETDVIIDKSYGGRTALDVAIEGKFQSVAHELLKHEDWKDLMFSPGWTPLLNSARDTTMRRLIKTLPEIAKEVFDKCFTRSNDGTPYNVYDFRYLDDTWMSCSEDGKTLIHHENPYNVIGHLHQRTRPYSENTEMIYNNHPLRLLVRSQSDCEYLLIHPLVRGLLNHKWNTLGKYLYFIRLTMYCLFLLFFSAYVMTTSAPYNAFEGKNEDGACDRIEHQPSSVFLIWGWGALILIFVHLLKEFGKLFTRRLLYFSIENLLELFIYVSDFLVVLDLDDCAKRTGIRQGWQWHLAAGSAFLQWVNLLMIIRKLPRFGIYVVMLVDIVKTFSRFFLIFVLFVFAFSITFCIIFQNRPEFSTLSSSMLKTTIMMIGEFEYTGIFHGDADHHQERMYTNDNFARLLFFAFAIVMTILLMNLLIGLAVDDIKSVQEKAEIKLLAMQVDLVLEIDSMTPIWMLKKMVKGGVVHYRNQSSWWKRLQDRLLFDETQEIVEETTVLTTDPAVVESERRFTQQQTALDTVKSNVNLVHKKLLQIDNKQERMEEKQQQISDKLLQMTDILETILKAVQKEESEPPTLSLICNMRASGDEQCAAFLERMGNGNDGAEGKLRVSIGTPALSHIPCTAEEVIDFIYDGDQLPAPEEMEATDVQRIPVSEQRSSTPKNTARQPPSSSCSSKRMPSVHPIQLSRVPIITRLPPSITSLLVSDPDYENAKHLRLPNGGTNCFIHASLQCLRRLYDIAPELTSGTIAKAIRPFLEGVGVKQTCSLRNDLGILIRDYETNEGREEREEMEAAAAAKKATLAPQLQADSSLPAVSAVATRSGPGPNLQQHDIDEFITRFIDRFAPESVANFFYLTEITYLICLVCETKINHDPVHVLTYTGCKGEVIDIEGSFAPVREVVKRVCEKPRCKARNINLSEKVSITKAENNRYLWVRIENFDPHDERKLHPRFKNREEIDNLNVCGSRWKMVAATFHLYGLNPSDSGHFVAFTRDDNNVWWEHNDDKAAIRHDNFPHNMDGLSDIFFERIQ